MNTVFIYALKDPRDGSIRYVGKAKNPAGRLLQHLQVSEKKSRRVQCWISSLLEQGLSPGIEILDQVPAERWAFFERAYIQVFRETGAELTNATDGGEGVTMTPETRAKIGASHLGTFHSPETVEKMRAAKRGRRYSSLHRAAIGASKRGLLFSSEHRAALSAAKTGKPWSALRRANFEKRKIT